MDESHWNSSASFGRACPCVVDVPNSLTSRRVDRKKAHSATLVHSTIITVS